VSVLTMRILPDPILRRQARKVGKVPANMKKFTDDMIETMHAELGVGLAANQIGSLQKVAVIQLPDWEEALVLINPEIVKQEGEREVVEGCLSIPGYRGLVKRSVSVRARAIGLDGKVIRIKADGLLAQLKPWSTRPAICKEACISTTWSPLTTCGRYPRTEKRKKRRRNRLKIPVPVRERPLRIKKRGNIQSKQEALIPGLAK